MPSVKEPTKIERGKSYEIIEKLKEQNFTGLLRVSFKTDEISKSELIVENGVPIAMKTKKIRTGRILMGNEAFQDFINAENCVAEFYLADIKSYLLSLGVGSSLDLGKLLEFAEVETKPSEDIRAATLEELSEFDRRKLEVAKILDSELGKIARKYVKIVESVNSLEELFEARNRVFDFLNSTTTFLPKEKVARVKSEIDRILEALKRKETLEIKESDEFENFKKELISKFDKVIGSRELREILDELEDWSDLIQKYPQIKKAVGKFATIVPWNKVEELLRMIEERVAEETGTKLG
ncbi:MAG: DUF2226 domain-containing protein [Archaeoglobaceae archaeon]